MLRSAEERELRKAAVLDALQALRMAFPLQTLIESAAPVARAAYAEVLRRWVNQGLHAG